MKENYCRLFHKAATKYRDSVALQTYGEGIGTQHTYGMLLAETYAIASALEAQGVRRADRVGIIGENHPKWAVAYLGALFAEAIVVPLDTQLSTDELRNLLEDSGIRTIFSSTSQLGKVLTARDALARPLEVVCMGQDGHRAGVIPLERFSAAGREVSRVAEPPDCAADDVAILVYTSGTTGRPKGVMITHHNLVTQITGVTSRLDVTAMDTILGILPLHHTLAQLGNFLMPLVLGATVTYLEKVTSQTILAAFRDCRITVLIGVPQLYYLFHQRIFEAIRLRPLHTRAIFRILFLLSGRLMRLANLRVGKVFFRSIHAQFGGHIRIMASAGSSFDAKVARDMSALGFIVLQGYGLTETSGAATITPFKQDRVGTVGVPIKGVEVAIDNPDSSGVGEVIIRGDVVMKGYYNRPDLTAEVIRGGWFHSGDLGYLDRDDLLYITGRQKDVIVLSTGKNIYPEEIENHYVSSSAIREICVLGSSSGQYGEEHLFAVIVPDFDYLKAHKIANATEAIRYDIENLTKELPKHKRILDYRIQSTPLPRTSTRKIKRFEVKREVDQWLSSGRTQTAPPLSKEGSSSALFATPVAQRVTEAIQASLPRPVSFLPQSNVELDLGFDSLHRIELLASIEQTLGIKFSEKLAAEIYTVGDLIRAAESLGPPDSPGATAFRSARQSWREILNSATVDDLPNQDILESKPIASAMAYFIGKLLFLCAKILFRLEVTGREHLPGIRPYLICPNHQSFIDPFVISSTYPYKVKRDSFHLGATEYFTNRFTSAFARFANVVPVDADLNLYRAMTAASIGLKHNRILNIYPEGSRTPDGELKEFKKGAAILAAEMGLPIVPVAIDGAYNVWPRATRRIRLAKVRVAFGSPIDVKQLLDRWGEISDEQRYTRLTEELRRRVTALLEEIAPHDQS